MWHLRDAAALLFIPHLFVYLRLFFITDLRLFFITDLRLFCMYMGLYCVALARHSCRAICRAIYTMEAEADFSRSKAVICKVDRNTETIILWFFDRTGVILELVSKTRKNLFPRHVLLINPCMHICPYLWSFGICRTLGFGPILLQWLPNLWGCSATFAFCIKALGLATFFIAPQNCNFLKRNFWAN